MSEVKEHSVIYLSPSDDPEREWCQDDVWEESVRYNLGADFDRVTADRDSLRQQLDDLELSRRSWMDEAKSLERLVDMLKSLLLEVFYSVESELSALSAQEVETMRGKVFAATKNKALNEGLCRGDARLGTACGKCSRCERAKSIESLAKTIYETWVTCAGYVPWVEGGNSLKQQEARQIASRTFELALANQVEPLQ